MTKKKYFDPKIGLDINLLTLLQQADIDDTTIEHLYFKPWTSYAIRIPVIRNPIEELDESIFLEEEKFQLRKNDGNYLFLTDGKIVIRMFNDEKGTVEVRNYTDISNEKILKSVSKKIRSVALNVYKALWIRDYINSKYMMNTNDFCPF